ncbi:MAG: hypothetical protein KatS3mg114_0246 [Planctomycetaceae bacterium]|nr:MAG: hypothetical protein KatS3mg114_0246 [Planctomycetaceae bacterium]
MRFSAVLKVGLWVGFVVAHAPLLAQGSRPRVSLEVLQQQLQQLRQEYAEQLQALQAWCRDHQQHRGEAEIAEVLQQLGQEPVVGRNLALPEQLTPPLPPELPDAERTWRSRWLQVRKEYARQLYLLSRRGLHAGYPSWAYDRVREVAQHDPDHQRARELLGYVLYNERWVTPYTRKMLQLGYVWHERFGWLPQQHVERYERGERYFEGRWISAEREAELRQDFSRAWEIRTDHYLIRTNHSLERGVELGRALEDFYQVFHQTFAAFFNDPEHLSRVFNGTASLVQKNPKPYLVHYYRQREEYIHQLEPRFPSIQKTNGIYLTQGRTAHFYDDPQRLGFETLYHEATHQLFYESHPLERAIGQHAHFWVIEGVACYMESLSITPEGASLGRHDAIRFRGARANYIHHHYYIPLRQLTAWGMSEFQAAPQLARVYAQAAGLVHFFMHYEGGRYRDAFISHLIDLYSAQAKKREQPATLEELTGVSYEELDRQYGEYVRAIEHELTESVP